MKPDEAQVVDSTPIVKCNMIIASTHNNIMASEIIDSICNSG